MAENTRRFYNSQKTIEMGTANTNLSLGDCIPLQHITGDNGDKSGLLQQLQCIPVGDCGAIVTDTYTFSCRNFPSFTPLLGQQLKVRFTVANTYGDCQASPATFPKITIGSLTLPIYAQGKSVGTGFNTANQVFNACVMGTDISDPSTWWLDLDSNVRQSNSSYTIMTDGSIVYKAIKYLKGNVPSNKTLTLTHSADKFICRICMQGTEGALYGVMYFLGYGPGTISRDHVVNSEIGGSINYTISDNKLNITNLSSSNACDYYIEVLLGDIAVTIN